MSTKNRPMLAVKGLCGWVEYGRCQYGTYHMSGVPDMPKGVKYCVDMSKVYETSENPVSDVWRRPNLGLELPDNNVRHLFEGCVGSPGTTDGHAWEGFAPLGSCDRVGLNVYLYVLKEAGGEFVKGKPPQLTNFRK